MRLCPRLCPTQVIEQRVTLGTLERTQLKQLVEAYNRDKWGELIPNVMLGAGGVLAGAGVCVVGYGVYKVAQAISLEWIKGVFTSVKDDLKDAAANVKDGFKEGASDLGDMLGLDNLTKERYTTRNPPVPQERIDPVTGEVCYTGTPDWKDEHGIWHEGTAGTCSPDPDWQSSNPLGVPNYDA